MYPGVSAGKHFQEANTQVLRAMDADAAFARSIGKGGQAQFP